MTANPGGLSTVSQGVLSGSLVAGTYYLMVHGYQATNSTGSYTVSVADTTTRQPRVVTTDNTAADGTQSANGVNLGDVKSSAVTYNGTTTGSTPNKWTASLAGTGNGATAGCRASASENTTHEHVFRFSVSGTTNRSLTFALTRDATTFDPVLSVFNGSGGSLPIAGSLSSRILGCQRAYTAGSTVFTGAPALNGTGNATTGGTIAGNFAPGTYYLAVNAATGGANSYGAYTLVVTDNTVDAAIPAQKWADNARNVTLSAGGSTAPTSGATPYADFGTLTLSGVAYHGTITASTPSKWSGNQPSAAGAGSQTYNCRTNQVNRNRSEHVFKLTVPASTTAQITVSEQLASTSLVFAYFNALSDVPQINSPLGQHPSCATLGSTSGGTTASSGTTSFTNSSGSAVIYWLMLYPDEGDTVTTTRTRAYDLSIAMQGFAPTSAKWAANSQDASLNTSISVVAPYVDWVQIGPCPSLEIA